MYCRLSDPQADTQAAKKSPNHRNTRWPVARALKLAWLGSLLLGAIATSPARAQAVLPIFDTHIHYSHDAWEVVPTAEVITLMRKAGLKAALVSSSNDEGTQRLYNAAPELIVPSLRPYRLRGELSTWVNDPAVLAHVEQRLKRYRYAAFGEFHLYGADADAPNVRAMMKLAIQNNLILHAHSDSEAIERLFMQAPNAKILWAHSGFDRPAVIANLLRKHKQLWADLAYRSDMGGDGKVDAEWAAVFKEFPDRFMVGTDTFTPERLHYIPEHARFTRGWLSALPAELAEKIAYRNAEALILPVWRANRAPASANAANSANSASLGDCAAGLATAPQRAIDNGRVRVFYSALPAQIKVGQAFSIQATICPGKLDAKVQSFAIDASMPEHRHGMNYVPKVSAQGERGFLADGLVFHMPGNWQIVFDLLIDGRNERLTHSLKIN